MVNLKPFSFIQIEKLISAFDSRQYLISFRCYNHIGWKFTAAKSGLKPLKFYGFSRKSINSGFGSRDVRRPDEEEAMPMDMSTFFSREDMEVGAAGGEADTELVMQFLWCTLLIHKTYTRDLSLNQYHAIINYKNQKALGTWFPEIKATELFKRRKFAQKLYNFWVL